MFNAVSPYSELIAYETLWARAGATIKKLSEYMQNTDFPSKVQMDFLDLENQDKIIKYLNTTIRDFSILTANSYQYPQALKDPKHQIKILYYKGDLGLLEAPKRISIVGARKASDEGKQRAAYLAKLLVREGFVIVSGLAEGIDTAAMESTIKHNGKLIGAIGTPINEYYPKENKNLQDYIGQHHLLISHVPLYRYSQEPFNSKRFYFPQRNVTMASLSDATIIVEASDTSGSLTQARACLEMGRKLFILDSCFTNQNITWPHNYLKKGAIRVKNLDDILGYL